MSSGVILSFLRRPSNSGDWRQDELAEFYRVESALVQAGISILTDRGITDEGDPWFVFCRADNEEVIAHFARIDGEYVIVSSLHPEGACGYDFGLLVRQLVETHHLMLPIRRRQGQKILLHPAALLTAMVASAYILAGDKDAVGVNSSSDGNTKSSSIASLLTDKIAVLAAAGLVAVWLEHQAESVFKFLESTLFNTPTSDDKAAHAITAQNDAQIDMAILHAIRDELTAHRSDLTNSHSPAVQGDGEDDQGSVVSTQGAIATPPSALSNANSATAPNDATNDHVAAAHSDVDQNGIDSTVVQTNAQPIPVRDIELAVSAPSSSAAALSGPAQSAVASSSSGLVAELSEAVLQLATADASSSLLQPIVLSTNPESLDLALQQAFAQAGLNDSFQQGGSSSSALTTLGTASTSTGVSTASSTGTAPTESQILHTVEAFLLENPSYEVTISGSNVVIIDDNVSDESNPNFGVLTWNLGDGHTLSIVGILPAHHAAATA